MDMKLIGGKENNHGCFGAQNVSLLDNICEESMASQYIIRLKIKKNNMNENANTITLNLLSYFRKNVNFK
jgi:hypothetical protein